jgi:hypothetical protein
MYLLISLPNIGQYKIRSSRRHLLIIRVIIFVLVLSQPLFHILARHQEFLGLPLPDGVLLVDLLGKGEDERVEKLEGDLAHFEFGALVRVKVAVEVGHPGGDFGSLLDQIRIMVSEDSILSSLRSLHANIPWQPTHLESEPLSLRSWPRKPFSPPLSVLRSSEPSRDP